MKDKYKPEMDCAKKKAAGITEQDSRCLRVLGYIQTNTRLLFVFYASDRHTI